MRRRLILAAGVAALMLTTAAPALADYWLGGQYFRGMRGRVLVPTPWGAMPSVEGPIPQRVPTALQPPVPGPPPPPASLAFPWTAFAVPPVPALPSPPLAAAPLPPDVEAALADWCATHFDAPVCARL